MKIGSASLLLQSEHAAAARQETRESLRAWVGPTRPDFEGRRAAEDGRPAPPAAVVRLSDAARSLASPAVREAPPSAEARALADAAETAAGDPMLALLKSMIELFIGRPVKVFSAAELAHEVEALPAVDPAIRPAVAGGNAAAGFGIEYDYHAVREESERMRFSAQGTIRTADGQQINVTLDLAMNRSYREEVQVSLRAGDARRKDPLVINFDGSGAQLADRRFSFDIDGDGRSEQVALLGAGSGYLALDLNANGRIDSGRELLGPGSGSGFGELAALDTDGNGWVDENDPAYRRLRIWTPAADGGGTLDTLAARQVGALAALHVGTPFELRGAGNSDLGAVRASGLYLTEDGRAGSLQEIDLTV